MIQILRLQDTKSPRLRIWALLVYVCVFFAPPFLHYSFAEVNWMQANILASHMML